MLGKANREKQSFDLVSPTYETLFVAEFSLRREN